jgi:hypothetical protein
VNRSLKMTSVQWIGFDMDYTLAICDQAKMDSLQVDATVQRLVKRGCPPDNELSISPVRSMAPVEHV